MAKLLDESWDKVNLAQAKADGFVGIIGYVSEDNTGKNLNPAIIHEAHALGMSVTVVYEFDPAAPLLGGPRGERDATVGVNKLSGLAAPRGIGLYAALDRDWTLSQLPSVLAYVNWFQRVTYDAGYRHGAYAGYYALKWMIEHGWHGLKFQAAAWSDGLWLPDADIRQTNYGVHVAGGTVDLDDAYGADWGQWVPPAPPPQPARKDDLVDHWHTVQRGSVGQAVMVAQGLLLAHGLDVGSGNGRPDGDFGPHTESSTRALQSRYGIAVDGVFGPHTASVGLYGVDVV